MDKYIFSNEQIDQACRQVEKAMISYGVERREALRIKLTFEEVLLEYQGKLGEEASFLVRCSSRFSAIRVEITVPGESFDPMEKAEEDANVMRELLAGQRMHLLLFSRQFPVRWFFFRCWAAYALWAIWKHSAKSIRWMQTTNLELTRSL